MSTPKYNPPIGEPRIALAGNEPRIRIDLVYSEKIGDAELGYDVTFVSREIAEAEQQRIALTIANRVYGDELARLAGEIQYQHNITESIALTMLSMLTARGYFARVGGSSIAQALDAFVQLCAVKDDPPTSAIADGSTKPILGRNYYGLYYVDWTDAVDGKRRHWFDKAIDLAAEFFAERYAEWKATQP